MLVGASLAAGGLCVVYEHTPNATPLPTTPAVVGSAAVGGGLPVPSAAASAEQQMTSGKTEVVVRRTRHGHCGVRRLTARVEKPAK